MAQTTIRMGGGRIVGCAFLERVGDGYRFEFREDVTALGRPLIDLFAMVAGGELDLCYFASSYLAHAVPDLAVFDLPFRISSRAELQPKLDGALGNRLAKAVARDTAFVSLGYWDNGLRHISNGVRPIRRPDDCQGLSIRTMDSAVHQATFRALGFTPCFIDVKDFPQAVRTGAVDAQENPLTNMVNFKVHEIHSYLTLTGHLCGVTLVLGNRARIASWPKLARDALHEAVAVATEAQRRFATEEDVARLTDLAAAEVHVIGTGDFDRAAFVAATAEVVATQSTAIDPEVLRIVRG